MLTIESVSKRFRNGTWGLRGVSMTQEAGVLGLLGPNGAGKTTLMQMIATITRPTEGRITFQGTDLAKNPDTLRQRLGYLPQDFGVYDNLSAYELLRYLAALKGVHEKSRVAAMLETVNLHHVADRRVGGFSGGMRQRLGIAQALINDPDLVIVDEPTAGLDPEERVRFRNVLSEIGFGKLVILSTHIVSDIESIATRIAILRQGELIALDTPEGLLQQAAGKVWSAVVTSEELASCRDRLKISSAVRKADGVHIRVVHPEPPMTGAVESEPTLEDAYLHAMSFDAPPQTAAAAS